MDGLIRLADRVRLRQIALPITPSSLNKNEPGFLVPASENEPYPLAVLICRRPDAVLEPAIWGADSTAAGQTKGGQRTGAVFNQTGPLDQPRSFEWYSSQNLVFFILRIRPSGSLIFQVWAPRGQTGRSSFWE